MKAHIVHNSGFTLLEAIVAIGIILIGIVSIISLSTVVLFGAQQVRDEFLAEQFARESIEAVRSIRDSYWLTYDANSTSTWDDFFPRQAGQNYAAIVTSSVNTPNTYYALDYTPDNFGYRCATGTVIAPGPNYDCTAIWYNEEKHYTIQTTDPNFDQKQFTQTKFSRLVWVYPICRDTANEQQEQTITDSTKQCSDLGAYTQVGVDVQVVVQWSGKKTPQQYILEEQLYDWKY